MWLGKNDGSNGALRGRKMRRSGWREWWRELQGAYDGVAKYKKFSVILSAFSEQVQQTATHCGYCSSQSAVTWHDFHPDQITLVEGHRSHPHIHNNMSRHLPIKSYHWAAVSSVVVLDIVLITVLEETSLFIMKMAFSKQIVIPTDTLPNSNVPAVRQTTQQHRSW